MPDLVCDTSPLQYLHQLEQLHLLQELADRITVPPAVAVELAEGRRLGVDLPNPKALPWLHIESPASAPALPLITDLGPGEREVLALALEHPTWVAVLDDKVARRSARRLDLAFTGTLGLLLDAKSSRLIDAIVPLLDRLDELNFRLAPSTRRLVLRKAGEHADE